MAEYRYDTTVHGTLAADWFYSGTVEAGSVDEAREKIRALIADNDVVPYDCRTGQVESTEPLSEDDLTVELPGVPGDADAAAVGPDPGAVAVRVDDVAALMMATAEACPVYGTDGHQEHSRRPWECRGCGIQFRPIPGRPTVDRT